MNEYIDRNDNEEMYTTNTEPVNTEPVVETPSKSQKKIVSNEQFIRAWNGAEYLSEAAEAMGMKTLVYDPYLDIDYINNNNIKSVNSVEKLIKDDIDILVLTLPLTDSTRGIINTDLINKTKKNMVIVNTSRALIVDQESLIYLLEQKKIKAYLTDVLEEEPMIKDHPLLNFNNVIIAPHIGSRTYESVQRQGTMAVNNLLKLTRLYPYYIILL